MKNGAASFNQPDVLPVDENMFCEWKETMICEGVGLG